MRLLILSGLVALAAAAIPGLPACASNCVGTSFGSCSTLDVKCICSDSSLLSGLACCVSTACDAADQETTIQFADSLCAGQGVTNLPTAATCASTSGSATSTATSASSGTTSSRVTPVPQASSSVSSEVSSASSAAASASSSIASAISSSASASTASSGSTAASTAATSTAASSATAAGTSASATSNAGSKMEVGLGFGALLAGALAAI